MSKQDREKWDAKYCQNLGNHLPAEILEKFIGIVPAGRALDIACGNGRNSIFLQQRGFTVDAVDISTVATNHIENQANKINVICTDIDNWTIEENCYELILNINFLDRHLFPMIEKGLKGGGILIFESFTGGQNKNFCLTTNELLTAFPSLHIMFYEEKEIPNPDKFRTSVSLVATKN